MMSPTLSAAGAAPIDPGTPAPATRGALAALALSTLLAALGVSAANVALPTLAQAFGATFAQVQWVVLAYLLAVTTLIVSLGRLGDLAGRRRLLAAGTAVFSVGAVLCALAPTLWLLVAARGLQGLGAAAMMALTLPFVADIVPKAKSGRALGLLGTMSALGTALGPSVGGLLIAGLGWRSVFLSQLPMGLLAWVLVRRCLPADRVPPRAPGQRLDGLGTLLLAATLGAYALAMTRGPADAPSARWVLLGAALVGAALFVRAQARTASPLIDLRLFRNPVLGAGLAASAMVMAVMMATLVVGPFYLSRGLGLDMAAVGLVVSVGPVVTALSGWPAGRMVDRVGARAVSAGGVVAVAAGCLMLWRLPVGLGVVGYVAAIAVTTAGYASFQAANTAQMLAAAPPERRGVVSAMLNLSRNLGLITGAAVLGAVFMQASGAANPAGMSPRAVVAGLHTTFGAAAVLVILVLAFTTAAGRGAARAPSRGLA